MKRARTAIGFFLAMVVIFPFRANAAKGFYSSSGIGVEDLGVSGPLTKYITTPGVGGALELVDLGYGIDRSWAVGFKLGAGVQGAKAHTDWASGGSEDLGYLGIYGRYNFDRDQRFVPYIDAGIGTYLFEEMFGKKSETDTANIGLNIDVGGNYFVGSKKRWFIGPEISYQYADLNSKAQVDIPDSNTSTINVGKGYNVNMILVLFKIGCQWKK
jgi:opacity protein-like surface antigen